MNNFLTAILALLLSIASLSAGETEILPTPPGQTSPAPRQRGLNEIHELPTRPALCPVCRYTVTAPLADALMRRPPGAANAITWQMHAERRDTDLCPYPGPGKLPYQADILVCPSCGYAQETKTFEQALPPEAAQWVLTSLRPAIRQAEQTLIGPRRDEMAEEEIVAWFNDQERIPDTVRTEHLRTYLAATHAPPRERARASLLAAWAARRVVASPPQGEFLARRAGAVAAELATAKRATPGLPGDIAALQGILRRIRQNNRDALPGARHMAARLLLAGLWDRLGFLGEAETLLQGLYHECRERFLRPDQDPLWQSTQTGASRTERLNQLETIRSDAGGEVLMRLEMVRRERDLLSGAADALRQALGAGEYDASPDEARFQAYMIAECLRRAGNLPLAAEWFKNLLAIAPADSKLRSAAESQLRFVGEEAGDKVNLLSAFGQDGELFDRLRRICD